MAPRRLSSVQRWKLLFLASGAGVASMVGGQPTGHAVTDFLWTACFGVVVVFLLLESQLSTLALFLGTGIIFTTGGTRFAVIAALLVLVSCARKQREIARLFGLCGVVATLSGLRIHGPFAVESIVVAVVVAFLVVQGFRQRNLRGSRRSLVLGVALLLPLVFAIARVASLRSEISRMESKARSGIESVRDGNFDDGVQALTEARDSLRGVQHELAGPAGRILNSYPLVSPQYRYVAEYARQIDSLLGSVIELSTGNPVDRLRPRRGTIDIDAATSLIAPVATALKNLDALIGDSEVKTSKWVLPILRSKVNGVISEVENYRETVVNTKDALESLPWLLGQNSKRVYLVEFLTPVENRSGGGFPGAYAELVIEDGKMSFTKFGHTSTDLVPAGENPDGRIIRGPDDYLARYEQFGAGNGTSPAKDYIWLNVTASPDMPSFSDVISQLYPQSGGVEIDGVITVDVAAMKDILRITGPVDVAGVESRISAENVEEYLLRQQYFTLETVGNYERIDGLKELAKVASQKLLNMELPSAKVLGDAFGASVSRGGIRMWVRNARAQDLMTALGLDGNFGKPQSIADVGLMNTNGGANKNDIFLSRSISLSTNSSDKGDVVSMVTVELRSGSPSTGWPGYVLANPKGYPRGTNVTILSLYSPMYCSATVNGKDTPPATEQELGWLVHSLGFGIPPKGKTTVVFTCKGNVNEIGLGIGTPRIHGQVVVNDDQWNATVTTPKKVFTYNGPLNSNKWVELK